MSATDVPSDVPVVPAVARTRAPAVAFISWVALALMTTSSVASLRPSPTMAVYGLGELVAIRSVADARQFPPEECLRAAEWVRDRFAGVGFVDLELAETADGSRAVIGARPAAEPDAPTVLLYAHYDVQPPLDEHAWRTPPFTLSPVDGRWYGRGAADCKGTSSCT